MERFPHYLPFFTRSSVDYHHKGPVMRSFGVFLVVSMDKQFNKEPFSNDLGYHPREQGSWGHHGAHLGPAGPRWAPCWPHEPCYQGCRSCHCNTLRWRQNGHDSVSNHQPHHCLLNRSFGCRSKKTSKLRVTGLCAGNSSRPVNSPHKWPVTRKIIPFNDVIMALIDRALSCSGDNFKFHMQIRIYNFCKHMNFWLRSFIMSFLTKYIVKHFNVHHIST